MSLGRPTIVELPGVGEIFDFDEEAAGAYTLHSTRQVAEIVTAAAIVWESAWRYKAVDADSCIFLVSQSQTL